MKESTKSISENIMENDQYISVLNSVEKLSTELKAKLIRKLLNDADLSDTRISYCSCCENIFQEDYDHFHSSYICRKCEKGFCDDCIGNRHVAVLCDNCEILYCTKCIEGNIIEKIGGHGCVEHVCISCEKL